MAKRKLSTFERLQRGERLNRKQRREVQQRLNLDDPGLDIIHRDAAGIDVGNESHFVSVPPDRNPQPIREFGSWTAALEEMARWLKDCRIRTVVMQSTGVYWIALEPLPSTLSNTLPNPISAPPQTSFLRVLLVRG
jgi:hypothetical protein